LLNKYLQQHLEVSSAVQHIYMSLGAGPYLGILRPWAQENFAPPPSLFLFSYVEAKTTQKTDKKTKHSVFSIDLP
jgi:hypothetical protein